MAIEHDHSHARLTLLWAKIGAGRYEDRHCLLWHMIDVAKVAHHIWCDVLQPAVRSYTSTALCAEPTVAGGWLAFWAGAHDIGKASPGFQSRDASGDAKLQLNAVGFDFPGFDSPPHGVVTTAVLGFEQANHVPLNGTETDVCRRMATAVGGHHGLFAQRTQLLSIVQNDDVLGGPAWKQAREQLLRHLGEVLGLAESTAKVKPDSREHWPFMFVAGLTSVADWIASNPGYFPHRAGEASIDEYAAMADSQAQQALNDLGWIVPVGPADGHQQFTKLFPTCDPPRPLQQAMVDAVEEPQRAGLLLLEAPTGEGKTEAAFFAAERWLHGGGGQGAYIGLPTMATGTQMFERFGQFVRHRYPGERVNMHLLHSGSVLNERYEALQRAAAVTHPGPPIREIYDDAEGHEQARLVADAWFAVNRKQAMLAPFGVGTIDQSLLSVLQVKHGFVRLFGLAGKAVILDEVHAYDVYTSTLLDHLLTWLRGLGCRVVLLSATLPAARRKELLDAWMGRECQLPSATYPRLLVADERGISASTFSASPGREARIQLATVSEENLPARLVQVLEHGGCAAVIRNTVGQAQDTFRQLRDLLGAHGIELELLHARYPFDDRQRRETAIVRRYGKGKDGLADSTHRPHRSVLVATQVIEQSLDLDFDVMVSDVAPIDLLLQRAGRLHRHHRLDRPVKQAELWLIKAEPNDDGVPNFGASERVYLRSVLLRTSLLLLDRSMLRLPEETEGLVEAVYGDDPQKMLSKPDAVWRTAIYEADRGAHRQATDHKRLALQLTIGDPQGGRDPLTEFCQQLDEDNPEVHASLQAATRLTRPSVSVVLLYRNDEGLSFSPDGDDPVNVVAAPSLSLTKRLLGRSVSLQHAGVVKSLLDEPSPTGWLRSSLLRFHRLVCLDAEGIGCAGDWCIQLDDDLGITITRQSPSDNHGI